MRGHLQKFPRKCSVLRCKYIQELYYAKVKNSCTLRGCTAHFSGVEHLIAFLARATNPKYAYKNHEFSPAILPFFLKYSLCFVCGCELVDQGQRMVVLPVAREISLHQPQAQAKTDLFLDLARKVKFRLVVTLLPFSYLFDNFISFSILQQQQQQREEE